MTAEAEFDQALELYQHALSAFIQGNPEPVLELCSHSDDVSLNNPIAPPARGWQQVVATTTRAAARLSDGQLLGCEIIAKYVTPDLGYVVWIEHEIARVSGSAEMTPADLRVTLILRPEAGGWKVIHRHADLLTTGRPSESTVQ